VDRIDGGRVVAAPDGTLFWAQVSQHLVVRIGPDGRGGCYAGTGESGSSGDGGPALQARLDAVTSLAYDPQEQALYLADTHDGDQRIRKVDAAGVITTVVGQEELLLNTGLTPQEQVEERATHKIAFDARQGRLYYVSGFELVCRTRDGQVKVLPNSRGDYLRRNFAPDPTGGGLVTTQLGECDVTRISDDGKVRTVPGGRLRLCASQLAVDASGDIWLVTDDRLVVLRPGR
jgi:hypothetical protein